MSNDLKGNQNLTNEIGLSRLSIGSASLSEKLAEFEKQREIERTMVGVIEHRGNVHTQSCSMLPERPSVPTPPKGTGFVDRAPLETPHVRYVDQLVADWEREEKAKGKG